MKIKNSNWINCYETVIGKSHLKVNMPNQDAVISKCISENIFISAVADGHGSLKCTRSEIGAKFAVEASVEILEAITDKLTLDENKLNIKAIGRFYTKNVVALWRKKVQDHIKETPIEFDNLDFLSVKEVKSLKKNKYIAYGSTLLIVLLIHDYIVCYQLGDGDIMFVSKAKNVTIPIKRDTRHLGNDTLSLCLKNADKEFKIRVFRDLKHALDMIILSTDGYSNSFSSESGFLKVGTDIYEMISSDGITVIEENLREWIEDTSNHGSGDDTTVSIISRIDTEDADTVKIV